MSAMAAIRLSGVGKRYRIYDRPEDRLKQMLWRGKRVYFREFEAVKPLDLTVHKGQTVGIVGCNGSGKSTLLQMVCGTLAPTQGQVEVQGRISALLELGAGFNPAFTGRENIFLNAAILGLSEEETRARYEDIVAFSGLDVRHLEQAVSTYSSGMYVRLAFAVAIAVDPDILVVDEALAVGDEAFQRKCFARIHDLQEKGATILFVSHAAQTVVELCSHAILMDQGEKICEGEPKDIITGYHRLIFAPHEKRDAIREELKQGRIAAQSTAIAAAGDASSGDNLQSESRMEYEAHGGYISNIAIETMDGQHTSIIQTGGRYRLRYRVTYSDEAIEPKYGMLIKTKRGINLGGAVALELAQAGFTARTGQVVDVEFMFDSPLRPGHYFINCGTTRKSGDDDVFVHRIIDALQIKVVDNRKTQAIEPAGNIDLNIQCRLIA